MIFWIFFDVFRFILILLFNFFWIFFWGGGIFFVGFYGLFSRLLLKITKDTGGHQNWPKIRQNSIKSLG